MESVDAGPSSETVVLCVALLLESFRRNLCVMGPDMSSARQMGKAPRCLATKTLYSASVKRNG